jgi:hypothetical protein
MSNVLFLDGTRRNSVLTGLSDIFNRPRPPVVVDERLWSVNTAGTATTDAVDFVRVQDFLEQVIEITTRFAVNAPANIPEVFDLGPLSEQAVVLKITETNPGTFYFVPEDGPD